MARFTAIEREALSFVIGDIEAGDPEEFFNNGCDVANDDTSPEAVHARALATALSTAHGKIADDEVREEQRQHERRAYVARVVGNSTEPQRPGPPSPKQHDLLTHLVQFGRTPACVIHGGTLRACLRRGWVVIDTEHAASITPEGRTAVGSTPPHQPMSI